MSHRNQARDDHADALRLKQASEWLLILRREATPAEINKWLEWTRQDARNLAAFERVRELKLGLDALDEDKKSAVVRELLPGRAAHRPERSVCKRLYYAVAASMLIAALTLGYLTVGGALRDNTVAMNRLVTTSHNHRFTLPDGTVIELGAQSELQVDYTADKRAVELHEGEAYFKVLHDPARPFVVRAGQLRVKDVGTTFDVRKNGDYVTVAVAEGKVAVAPHRSSGYHAVAELAEAAGKSVEVSLGAGEQLIADPAHPKLTTTEINAANIASWRSGELYFRDTPLSVVIANINRYAPYRIAIADPGVGKMRFTGMVSISHINDWLAAAREVFSLGEKRGTDGHVLLYSKKPA